MGSLKPPPAWTVETRSPAGTRGLARKLGASLPPGTVLALVGDLGAGKTSFVRGLAEGVGVLEPNEVVSPTYALMNVYPGAAAQLVHIDFYRLEDEDAVRALGLEEQIARPDAVVAVEWADKLPELLPDSTIWITFERAGPRARTIVVRGVGIPRGVRGASPAPA